MDQKWFNKSDLKGVAFRVSSPTLGLDILANDCIKGLWYYTLDERPVNPTYYGPYRTKEQADRAARVHEHWKQRLWYL
jgi:hypothetical protein